MGTTQTSGGAGPGRSSFGDRLRTYLIGVGIGLMLLGMFWMMKKQAAMREQTPQNGQGTSTTAPTGGPAGPPGGN